MSGQWPWAVPAAVPAKPPSKPAVGPFLPGYTPGEWKPGYWTPAKVGYGTYTPPKYTAPVYTPPKYTPKAALAADPVPLVKAIDDMTEVLSHAGKGLADLMHVRAAAAASLPTPRTALHSHTSRRPRFPHLAPPFPHLAPPPSPISHRPPSS